MSRDSILDELAKLAREDEARSEALEKLADEGEMASATDEEEIFVRSVLAGKTDEKLVTVALNALRTSRAEQAPPPHGVSEWRSGEAEQAPPLHRVADAEFGESAARKGALSPRRSGVVRLGAERIRRTAMFGAAVALAAGLLLYVRSAERGIELPAYEAVFGGADAPDRATASEGAHVTRGARLSLVARPNEPVAARLEGRAFGACSGPMTRLPADVQMAPTGAARVEGTPESLFGPDASGACTLAIVVALEGHLPETFEDARSEARIVKADLVIRER